MNWKSVVATVGVLITAGACFAEDILLVGPFSVVNKTITPPSDDKHDYMSLGSYWWPDPKKDDGLPYIRKDGRRNPETQTNSFDRASLGAMSKAVAALASAYNVAGDQRYADRAALLLRTWFLDPATKMNPNLQFGQAIPGRVEGRCFGIIDTNQFLPVIDAIDRLGPAIDADRAGLVEWFDQYLDWMLNSNHGKDEDKTRNNHGTWYDAQVSTYAIFVGKPEIARRVLEASKTRRIKSQIEPDGRQPHELARTKPAGYSMMNLRGMTTLATLGKKVGVDLAHYESDDGRCIQAAIDFLAPYADPNTKWPYEEIKHFNRNDLLPLLQFAADNYGIEHYEKYIALLPQ